jgi:hypothetical protein
MFWQFRPALFAGSSFALALSALAIPANAVQTQGEKSAATTPASILVFNQKAQGDALVVKYAYLPKNGYIAVFAADTAGKAKGEPIATEALKAGDSRDVKVALKSAPARGTKLWLGLYEEADNNGKFDDKDTAVWKVGELPLQNEISIE